LARALILLAEHPQAQARSFIVTDGQTYSTERIIRALAAAAGKRQRARIRIPRLGLSVAARAGDALERMTGRQSPISTERIDRLLGDAEYDSTALLGLGFEPRDTIEDVAPSIIAGITTQPNEAL